MGSLPCANCHRQALICFSPDIHSSESADDVGDESKPPERFRLPFEFNDTDKLGSWDVLFSEDI
jgi:hypothetical protein